MHKQDLALNNLQELIYNKTQSTNQPTYVYIMLNCRRCKPRFAVIILGHNFPISRYNHMIISKIFTVSNSDVLNPVNKV